MNDRELLELAAKAAGKKASEHDGVIYAGFGSREWNPLTDNGDALQLAVALGIACWRDNDVIWCNNTASVVGVDPCADMRRAIVRAAAEIGKSLQEQPQ